MIKSQIRRFRIRHPPRRVGGELPKGPSFEFEAAACRDMQGELAQVLVAHALMHELI